MNSHIFDTHWPNNAISYHLQPADAFLTIKCRMSDRITFIGSITPQTWGEKEEKHSETLKWKSLFDGKSSSEGSIFPNDTSDLKPVYNFLAISVSNSWISAKLSSWLCKSAQLFGSCPYSQAHVVIYPCFYPFNNFKWITRMECSKYIQILSE